MSTTETVRRAWMQFEPELQAHGYQIVEIEFVGGPGGSHILRIYIEKENGRIGLDDCTAVSQLLGPILDREDCFGENYCLEVSSPGFDRPLRRPCDFERFAGHAVKLQTQSPVEGRKRFSGTLKGLREDLIEVECDGVLYAIHLENLKKAHLDR